VYDALGASALSHILTAAERGHRSRVRWPPEADSSTAVLSEKFPRLVWKSKLEIFEVSVAVFVRIQFFGKRRRWVNAADFEKLRKVSSSEGGGGGLRLLDASADGTCRKLGKLLTSKTVSLCCLLRVSERELVDLTGQQFVLWM